MTGHTDEPADRFARARDEEEPGAHSGSESQARDRTIPGTASAKEGYQPEEGTAAGEPLRGVGGEERPGERRQGDEETGSGR
ncbi:MULTISPECIES: hypothetical protein [Streptomyces]|uniref:Uncharacterized protein n=1 Tax=Streptomyces flaveolus TaxID=67297 RepID=A0ABV3AGB2_9ACTN|nr:MULTISPECIES: hypothetical protein [Streptomyces]KMS92152.1 hypothetical protein ACZ91_06205 [Streptomyces regensis]KOG76033.1 hypothetical protein ADK77_00940 [Streptomyces antibioticus]